MNLAVPADLLAGLVDGLIDLLEGQGLLQGQGSNNDEKRQIVGAGAILLGILVLGILDLLGLNATMFLLKTAFSIALVFGLHMLNNSVQLQRSAPEEPPSPSQEPWHQQQQQLEAEAPQLEAPQLEAPQLEAQPQSEPQQQGSEPVPQPKPRPEAQLEAAVRVAAAAKSEADGQKTHGNALPGNAQKRQRPSDTQTPPENIQRPPINAQGPPNSAQRPPDDVQRSQRTAQPNAEPKAQPNAESKAQPTVAPAEPRTLCWCCADEKESSEFGMPTKRCTHDNDICKACLLRSLKACHLDVNKTDIKCPVSTCQQRMDVDDLIPLFGVKSECVIQFSNLALQELSQEEWFRCAWDDCESRGQLVAGGAAAANFLTCGVCRRRTCLTCKVPWHEGQTCKEYLEARRQRHQAEVSAETLSAARRAGFEVKQCPNPDCGRPISRAIQDKNTECHVMRCCGKGGDHECKNWEKAHRRRCDHTNANGEAFCGHRFCWECLRPVAENGDVEHLPSCPKHEAKLAEAALDENDPLVARLRRT